MNDGRGRRNRRARQKGISEKRHLTELAKLTQLRDALLAKPNRRLQQEEALQVEEPLQAILLRAKAAMSQRWAGQRPFPDDPPPIAIQRPFPDPPPLAPDVVVLPLLPPPNFAWARFECPEIHERVRPAGAVALAQAALRDQRVLITGPTGAGKTVLACAMVCAIRGARYAAVPWRADGLEVIKRAAVQVQCLAVEDGCGFGPTELRCEACGELEEPENPREIGFCSNCESNTSLRRHALVDELLIEIIHDRYERGQQTIVVTTDSQEGLASRIGASAAAHAFGGTVIQLDPTYNWQKR